ncbi:MAG: hypothetical protein M3040_07755 [Bacteroidota bacterium]|nr:hypothetical protein [Bacteroidota bacterium]
MGNHISIACASDERYFPGLLAMLSSLLLSTNYGGCITIHVIDGGIHPASWAVLENTVIKIKDVQIKRHSPGLKVFDSFPNFYFDSKLAYARLLLPSLLTENKVVYIDSDILFFKDIEQLWNMELNKAALTVQDNIYPTLEYDCPLYKELGFSPDDPYFNSGLMVMDLEKFRTDNIAQKTFHHLSTFPKACKVYDQSALNVTLHGNFELLHPDWNTHYYEDQYQVTHLHRHISSINYHFISKAKPWLSFGNGPYQQIFYALLQIIHYHISAPSFQASKQSYYTKHHLSKYLPYYYYLRGAMKKIYGKKEGAKSDFKTAKHWRNYSDTAKRFSKAKHLVSDRISELQSKAICLQNEAF